MCVDFRHLQVERRPLHAREEDLLVGLQHADEGRERRARLNDDRGRRARAVGATSQDTSKQRTAPTQTKRATCRPQLECAFYIFCIFFRWTSHLSLIHI